MHPRLIDAAELRSTLTLAVPVIAVEVGLMAMGTVDTMFMGRVSGQALASVAIGHTYFWVTVILGIGILFALDPLVTQAVGADDEPAIARAVQRGFILAGALAAMTSLLLVPAEPVLRFLRQPAEVIPDAARFARASIAGILPLYCFIVVRLMLQARERVAPLVIAILAGNVANAAFNWWFVVHEGWGPEGSGWASSISRWVMLATLLTVAWREIRPCLRPWLPETLAIRPMLRLLGIGIPIAIQYELEVNAFAVVAVMMGWIGATAMAGHQISINIAAMTFMVPLGISAAAAVRVGHAVGADDPLAVRRAAAAALAIGVGFMSLTAITMLVAPYPLARAYTPEAVVLATAVTLLPLAGLFQVFDGIQVVAVGILRGTGDTRTPMIINVLGFWLLGVPTSWYLGIHTSLGPRGLWWGFVVGLAAVAVLLLARVRHRLRQHIGRTVVDDREVVRGAVVGEVAV